MVCHQPVSNADEHDLHRGMLDDCITMAFALFGDLPADGPGAPGNTSTPDAGIVGTAATLKSSRVSR